MTDQQSNNAGKLLVKHVSHSFGPTEVLRDVSFSLHSGKACALVGPSGCGKTTLLHLCAGLYDLTEGEIHNSFETSSFMFQQPRLLPWKNALNNIAIGLKARRVRKAERESIAQQLGMAMGLVSEDMGKYPHELSGGMQQRVALARALALEPNLLLLDEPFSALDVGLKSELYALLKTQLNERNTSALIITHDLMEAILLSDDILLMEANPGRIVERFTIDKPFNERSQAWLYEKTAKLMDTAEVRKSFGLAARRLSENRQPTAGKLEKLLGVTGMRVINRVFGVLLCSLAVQFIFNGIRDSGLIGA